MVYLCGSSATRAQHIPTWDLLSTSRVHSGLLHAFIADPHTPLYLIKPITHISSKNQYNYVEPYIIIIINTRTKFCIYFYTFYTRCGYQGDAVHQAKSHSPGTARSPQGGRPREERERGGGGISTNTGTILF
jgi:hypothetical protein